MNSHSSLTGRILPVWISLYLSLYAVAIRGENQSTKTGVLCAVCEALVYVRVSLYITDKTSDKTKTHTHTHRKIMKSQTQMCRLRTASNDITRGGDGFNRFVVDQPSPLVPLWFISLRGRSLAHECNNRDTLKSKLKIDI